METLWNDLFFSLYKYLGFGVVFAVILLIAWPRIKQQGIKQIIIELYRELKEEKDSKYVFLFGIVFFMILSRTLICRDIWKVPWSNPIGEWGVRTGDGSWNVEGFENVILFIPLSVLYFCVKRMADKRRIIKVSVMYSLLFSCFIELCQLFGRLGTFQLSDIGQNTFGGFVGGLLYLMINMLKNKPRR